MQTKYGFHRMSADEFADWIDGQSIARTITRVQQHHTWKPRYSDFTGSNHFERQRAMKRYHVITLGWSDIGQHLSIFPDGQVVTGRSFNRNPACIFGANSGAFCIENVGNFDTGGDTMRDEQRDAILTVTRALLNRFNLGPPNKHNVVYHHWYDALGNKKYGLDPVKSCPGTNFFGGNKVADFEANFVTALTGAPATPAVPPLPPVGVAQYVRVIDADFLNLRAGPSSTAKDIGDVPFGAVLRVFGSDGRWLKVSNSKEHWVYGRYTQEVRRGVVNTDGTNCRIGPGTSFDIEKVVDAGEVVYVDQTNGSWLSIGPDLWVHDSLVTF